MLNVTIKYLLCFILIVYGKNVYANDGSYYGRGNHLIPIVETDITVKKEILSLKKVGEYIEVTVYYQFYNPKEEKQIIVGFEAMSPSGDVDATPKNGAHPYMYDFTVNVNDKILPYKIAYVEDSAYVQNGKIKSKTLKEIKDSIISTNYVNFYYVYYFTATFKKGLNIIKHTYKYLLSGSVTDKYNFSYVLTAANRWGNKQIDDFTLIIDMGDFQTFNINQSFFKDSKDWFVHGIGKVLDDMDNKSLKCYIQKGMLIFQKKNFKPYGALYILSKRYDFYNDKPTTTLKSSLPFSIEEQNSINTVLITDFEKKILRNLPFARRGYMFKDKALQDFYNQVGWYFPNPNYIPDMSMLNEEEKKWIQKWQ